MTEQERRLAVLIGLDWADAKFGIEHGFCTATEFSDIAFSALSDDSPPLARFVRYMPAAPEDIASGNVGEKHLAERLDEFLENEMTQLIAGT